MDERIKPLINQIKAYLIKMYGGKIKKVILYGSCVRGEATRDSDIDVLIVLEGEVMPGREIDRLIDLITALNLQYNVLLSTYPVSRASYETVNSPLLINVRREGVPV